MAVGTYGNVRASDISTSDLDMFYTFSSSRENNSNEVIRLDPTELLTELSIVERNAYIYVFSSQNFPT